MVTEDHDVTVPGFGVDDVLVPSSIIGRVVDSSDIVVVYAISIEKDVPNVSFCFNTRLSQLNTTEKMFLQTYKIML